MKKVLSLLTICLLAFNSFASNSDNNSIMSNNFSSVNESQNYIIVKTSINEKVKEYKYSYSSEEELKNADFESILTLIEKDLGIDADEPCMIDVSFTVSVGYNSSFVSVTVSGSFPCETWLEDARKLKADAQSLL
jgi:hypothetical protein